MKPAEHLLLVLEELAHHTVQISLPFSSFLKRCLKFLVLLLGDSRQADSIFLQECYLNTLVKHINTLVSEHTG